MKLIVISSILLSVFVCSFALQQSLLQFQKFKEDFNRSYTEQEEVYRLAVFRQNLKRIKNLNHHNPGLRFGINKFTDLTAEEFRRLYLNPKPFEKPKNHYVAPKIPEDIVEDIPDSFDWRQKGAVTAVKNQGECGSCWAFSATGNIEGQWFLARNSLVGLSEQNLVDCDHECIIYQNQTSCDAGCEGGLQPNAYDYVIKNKGIDTETSYPYLGQDSNCVFKPTNVGAKISNWTFISQDEDQMAAYLVAHGPLAIAADAEEWQFYLFGIFTLPCGTDLDHGILIVGYGEEVDIFDQKVPFWIVKNSWGADWGENGYIRIQRGTGECGLNLYVTSAII